MRRLISKSVATSSVLSRSTKRRDSRLLQKMSSLMISDSASTCSDTPGSELQWGYPQLRQSIIDKVDMTSAFLRFLHPQVTTLFQKQKVPIQTSWMKAMTRDNSFTIQAGIHEPRCLDLIEIIISMLNNVGLYFVALVYLTPMQQGGAGTSSFESHSQIAGLVSTLGKFVKYQLIPSCSDDIDTERPCLRRTLKSSRSKLC